jgi:hypothetical protein
MFSLYAPDETIVKGGVTVDGVSLSNARLGELVDDAGTLDALREYLTSTRYSLAAIAALVGEKDPTNFIRNAGFCALSYEPVLKTMETPLACLARLFLFGARVPESAYAVLPGDVRNLLEGHGLVERGDDGTVTGAVTIGEFESQYFVSDKLFDLTTDGVGVNKASDAVWPMSEWSLALHEQLDFEDSWTSLLDVGGGSGCLAILAGDRYANRVAIDLNARATAFSQLNARLAGAASLRCETADCLTFADPAIGKFDHVVFAAPGGPSGPTTGENAIVAHGGALGHELVIKFVSAQIDNLLAPGGCCHIWGVFAVEEQVGSIRRLIEDALPGDRFDVSVEPVRSGGLYLSREHIQSKKLPRGSHYAHGDGVSSVLEWLHDRRVIEVASAVVAIRHREEGFGF